MKLGRIKKRALLESHWHLDKPQPLCALCEREVIKDQLELHHLTPKSKGGTQTVALHNICHRQIHALFSENELAVNYNSIESLQGQEDISKFIAWIKRKPIDFKERAKKSNRLKSS
jgi:5-methylcytosine-specific restriction endonuclease McrA